jgi:hypothetical protein
VLGHPGDVLVELDHPVPDRRDLHEPAAHGAVDEALSQRQQCGVGVVVRLLPQQDGAARQPGLQVVHDLLVRLEHLLPGVGGDLGGEPALAVDGHDRLDAGGVRGRLVVLAEGGRQVDDAGAVLGRHEVGGEHAVRVRPAGEEVEGGV